MQKNTKNKLINTAILAAGALLFLQACTSRQESEKKEPTAVSAITIDTTSLVTHKHFSGSLEGVANVEIRPQAEGYLVNINLRRQKQQARELFNILGHILKEHSINIIKKNSVLDCNMDS